MMQLYKEHALGAKLDGWSFAELAMNMFAMGT